MWNQGDCIKNYTLIQQSIKRKKFPLPAVFVAQVLVGKVLPTSTWATCACVQPTNALASRVLPMPVSPCSTTR